MLTFVLWDYTCKNTCVWTTLFTFFIQTLEIHLPILLERVQKKTAYSFHMSAPIAVISGTLQLLCPEINLEGKATLAQVSVIKLFILAFTAVLHAAAL